MYLNIKLKLVKIHLELLRHILYTLLNFYNITDKIVISCSQQLDKVIVDYQKVKIISAKCTLTNNKSLYNIFHLLSRFQTSQVTITKQSVNWVLILSATSIWLNYIVL